MKSSSFSPKFKITQSMLKNLMGIERARGFLEAAKLSKQWIRKISHNAFLLETYHTTHIEGTQMSFEDSKKILTGKKVSHLDKQDIKEVKNYRDAFNLISDYLKEGKQIKESIIKDIHRELVKGVRGNSAHPGIYRNVQNYVGNALTGDIIYTPPPPRQVSRLMKEFVQWINEETNIHPVLISGIIQFQFVHIHPFLDGNGRTSRLLCAFYLYKSDYDFKQLFSVSEYYDKNRSRFYKALQSVRKNKMDMTQWLEYFVEGFLFQMQDVMDIGKKVILKDTLAKKGDLSQRQAIIMNHVLERGKLTPKDFEKLCGEIASSMKSSKTATLPKITKRTLQRDLKDMVDKKILRTEGSTNKKIYFLKEKG